jgi:predicted peroxiredoxin
MKNLLLLFISGLLILSCNDSMQKTDEPLQDQQNTIVEEPVKDGIFIHITESYEDPHRVLMPMKMAKMMAEDKDVIVYMDIHAVKLLVKGAEDLTYKNFDSFQTYLKQLVEKGIGIYACPTCLEVEGFTADDLIEGVQVAQKDKFFNFTDGKIITLDY